jgi:hypothetical protein
MPRLIPDNSPCIVRPDRHYSRSTAHYPPLPAFCFHDLTNCFFRKPFALINICVALWYFPQRIPSIPILGSTSKVNSFVFILLRTLWLREKSHLHWNQQLPNSFGKTPGVGWVAGANRRVTNAIGRPTQKIWMTTPMSIILNEKGNFAAAESGTTTRFIKKYTAMPYSAPERTGYRARDGATRLAAT